MSPWDHPNANRIPRDILADVWVLPRHSIELAAAIERLRAAQARYKKARTVDIAREVGQEWLNVITIEGSTPTAQPEERRVQP